MNEKTMQSEEMNIRLQESSANDGFEEVVSLRGANKVVKQGKGGKRKQVMFSRPVFSRGEDGVFQKNEKIKAIPEGKRLVGKADEFTASFSGEETTSELFSVEKGEHKLTVLTKEGCCCAKEKADSVVFENAKEDVDFTYDVLPDGVKEVIVIKQKKEEYRYGFCLETENLVPRLSANGKELLFVSTQRMICWFIQLNMNIQITRTVYTDGEFGTMYRSFAFDENGNNLVHEVDARGGTTDYVVDDKTSRDKEVINRMGNKTAYEYDVNGRTTKVTNLTPQRNEQGELVEDTCGNVVYDEVANVAYAYDAFDNMTEIVRGDGMKYVLGYNAFHNLKSIGVAGKDKPLVQYTYKDGNDKLKQMTYANGDRMEATYNGLGQMIAETWYDKCNERTQLYKYMYDDVGNIVKTLDITNGKVYSYNYEKDALIRAEEYTAVFTNDMVTSKTLVNSISYRYNDDGKLVEKILKWKDGQGVPREQILNYEYPENGDPVVTFSLEEKTVVFHSKKDSFKRKVFDELQTGLGYISRQFAYHSGEVTEEHKENDKVKSSPTTELVKEIIFSDGRTISYEYDKEERITKVTDSLEGITEYTYDDLGQLLTETKNGVVINQMTYDNYGNILSKNNVPYYYDSKWKDLLVRVGDQWIDYDDQGNPIIYMDRNFLTWSKGRQLMSLVKENDDLMEVCRCDYTYNVEGIRTSKTVNSVRHDYVIENDQILHESWGNNTSIFLYNNDEVYGIIFNGQLYSFFKNLQGDVIALVDDTGKTVARYSYDAWGVPTVLEDHTDHQVASVNPFLYRSYYYDWEIGMYYLQSRYYDPQVGRFINTDDATVLMFAPISYTMYSYCENDSVNKGDSLGYASSRTTCEAVRSFPGEYTIMSVFTYNGNKKMYLNYYFTDHVIFNFMVNDYKKVLNAGLDVLLAKTIYSVLRALSKKFPDGRTEKGIRAELYLHWLGYIINFRPERCNPADIGGFSVDENAKDFEKTKNLVSQLMKIPYKKYNQYKNLIKKLIKFFIG